MTRRSTGIRAPARLEVALPCVKCGDDVAVCWPPLDDNPPPGESIVARCRTCQSVDYLLLRCDDGVYRLRGPTPTHVPSQGHGNFMAKPTRPASASRSQVRLTTVRPGARPRRPASTGGQRSDSAPEVVPPAGPLPSRRHGGLPIGRTTTVGDPSVMQSAGLPGDVPRPQPFRRGPAHMSPAAVAFNKRMRAQGGTGVADALEAWGAWHEDGPGQRDYDPRDAPPAGVPTPAPCAAPPLWGAPPHMFF